mmetsp:Transcript_45411/g.75212  ORF Transcript_45411/g.75212 Transcript_45411/m.75212 type:complete len:91 (+) Transcript_45411:217-489(+)
MKYVERTGDRPHKSHFRHAECSLELVSINLIGSLNCDDTCPASMDLIAHGHPVGGGGGAGVLPKDALRRAATACAAARAASIAECPGCAI